MPEKNIAPFVEMQLSAISSLGGADGVIGVDVLSSFESVTFDFQNSVLVLEDRSGGDAAPALAQRLGSCGTFL